MDNLNESMNTTQGQYVAPDTRPLTPPATPTTPMAPLESPVKSNKMIYWGALAVVLVAAAAFATISISARMASQTPVSPTAPQSEPQASEPTPETTVDSTAIEDITGIQDSSVVDKVMVDETVLEEEVTEEDPNTVITEEVTPITDEGVVE